MPPVRQVGDHMNPLRAVGDFEEIHLEAIDAITQGSGPIGPPRLEITRIATELDVTAISAAALLRSMARHGWVKWINGTDLTNGKWEATDLGIEAASERKKRPRLRRPVDTEGDAA